MVTSEGQPRPLLLKVFGVRRLLPWIVGLLGVLALILAVSQIGSLERIVELARSARPAWLFLAVLVQAATYVCAALVWRQALRYAGHPRTLLTLVPLGIAKLFTDQVLPSGGVSGTMLVVSGLIRRRVPAEVAMAAMLAGLVSYEIAYLAVVSGSAGICGSTTAPLCRSLSGSAFSRSLRLRFPPLSSACGGGANGG